MARDGDIFYLENNTFVRHLDGGLKIYQTRNNHPDGADSMQILVPAEQAAGLMHFIADVVFPPIHVEPEEIILDDDLEDDDDDAALAVTVAEDPSDAPAPELPAEEKPQTILSKVADAVKPKDKKAKKAKA